MNYLKKRIVTLSLLLVFSFSAFTIFSQTSLDPQINNVPLFEPDYIYLTYENLEHLVDSLAELYNETNSKFYRPKLRNYFLEQLVQNGLVASQCAPIFPKIKDAQIQETITFVWGDPDRIKGEFNVNSFQLRTTEIDHQKTEKPFITIEPLTGFYIFSFRVNCDKTKKSKPSIIIVDKDIFLFEDPVEERKKAPTESLTNPSISNLQATPNPFKEELTINFNPTKTEQVSVFLYDFNGRILRQINNRMVNPGFQQLSLSTIDLPKGFYTISLQYAGQKLQQKLVKTD